MGNIQLLKIISLSRQVYTVEDREEVKDLEQEKMTLQQTLDQLEEELVKIETGVEEEGTDEEDEGNIDIVEQGKISI